MTVSEIIKKTATVLGRENVVEYLGGETATVGNAAKEVDLMVRCVNLVMGELACSFVPLIVTETKTQTDGIIPFSSLTHTVTEIVSVKFGDRNIPYTVLENGIKIFEESATVKYRCIPANFGLNDETGYSEKDIPSRIIAYGVASEVALSEHAFTESINYRKIFSDALEEFLTPKNFKMKGRSFIL